MAETIAARHRIVTPKPIAKYRCGFEASAQFSRIMVRDFTKTAAKEI
jgi:hypothetical protein